jgi:hypothetical protein
MAAPDLPLLPEKRVKLPADHLRVDDTRIAPQYKVKLKQLGYVSIEQVISVAGMKSVRSRLNHYLGTDVFKLLAEVPQRAIAPQLSFQARTANYSFGIRLKAPVKAVLPRLDMAAAQHVPVIKSAFKPPPTPLGSSPDVNFGGSGGNMPPVRDQANRGTCVAHAAVAAMEYYLITAGLAKRDTVDLSEQFLYWNCKSNDGDPNGEGTFLSFAMPLLFSDGCCLESVWPYNPSPTPGSESQGPPPGGAKQDAATRKAPGTRKLSAQSVQEIKDALARNCCVAVSVVVFDENWMPPEIRSSGAVTLPIPGGISNEGHAICLVGYQDLDGEPELGGGQFILRNSWDSYWGVHCDFGTGYGTIPYGYLTTYGMEAYSIE